MVNVPLLCSGDREIGFHRGWPETDASRLRTPDLSVVREPAPHVQSISRSWSSSAIRFLARLCGSGLGW